MGEIGIKQILKQSFIRKHSRENEKYIPTTKNVLVTPPQKRKKNNF